MEECLLQSINHTGRMDGRVFVTEQYSYRTNGWKSVFYRAIIIQDEWTKECLSGKLGWQHYKTTALQDKCIRVFAHRLARA